MSESLSLLNLNVNDVVLALLYLLDALTCALLAIIHNPIHSRTDLDLTYQQPNTQAHPTLCDSNS